MVETIAPVVYGDKRSRYRVALSLHVVAATLSAAAVGAVAGTVGLLLGGPWGTAGLAVIAVAAVIYSLREVTGIPIPVPDRHKQVPLWWRTFYSPQVAGILYGFGLGVGYLTYLSFGTYFVVTIAAGATGDPLLGAALTAPFGLARGVSVAIANRGSGPDTTASGIDAVDALSATRWPKALNAFVLAAIAGLALAGALS
jgi:hypothetical protein